MNDNFESKYSDNSGFEGEKRVTFEPQSDFETIPQNTEEVSVDDGKYFEVNAQSAQYAHSAYSNTPAFNPDNGSSSVQDNSSRRAFSCEWNGTDVSGVVMKRPYAEPPKKRKEKKSKEGKNPVALLLVLTILLSVFFGAGSAFAMYKILEKSDGNNGKAATDVSPSGSSPAQTLGKNELTTAEITEYCADSVVEIFTESVETGIFSQQYIESGAGSGVIIESDGYIVTNHHVIEDASKVSVTLRSGSSYEAQIIGSDRRMDLAIIKIEPDEKLTVASFGDSDTLVVGERIVAIGNPLGQLGGTVTEGILSALDREMIIDGQKMNLLQTDTAINPGNSGGGLFNSKGQLIGIVSAKSTGSEIEGLGFAIPINDVLDVVSDLKDYGYVKGRVDLGMELIDIDSIELMFIYGTYDYGCSVYRVYEGTNAYRAGFRAYDIIEAVNGESVQSTDDIELIINELGIGDEVTFTVRRGRTQIQIEMELEEYAPKNNSQDNEDELVINPGMF